MSYIPFPYSIRNSDPGRADQPAVYKIIFGKKYFIWKGKTLAGSVEQNCADINLILHRPKPGHMFMPVVQYIRKAGIRSCIVDVQIQTTDSKLLVETERELLEASRQDPACLNTSFEPYIPKWLAEELGAVITKPQKRNKAITATFISNDTVMPTKTGKLKLGSPEQSDKLNKLLDIFGTGDGK